MTGNAHSNTVELNGLRLAVKDGAVRRLPLNAWADPLRITGSQTRGDRTNVNGWAMEDWSAGFGFKKHKGAPPIDPSVHPHPSHLGFFNSTVETRWPGQVTLAGLLTGISYGTADNTNDDYSRIVVGPDGNGDIPYLCPSDVSGEIAELAYSGEVIDTARAYSTANYAPIAPVKYQGGVLFLGGVVGSTVPADYQHVDQAGTWSTITPATNLDHPAVSAVTFRDIIYVATIDNTSGTAILESSSDGGTNFAAITGMTVPTGAARLAQLVIYRDAQGAPALYMLTDDTLYLADLANSYFEPVMEFEDHAYTTGMGPTNVAPQNFGLPANPVVWNGNLYIPRLRSLIEYNFQGVWSEISPFVLGEMPNTIVKSGSVNFIASIRATESWLYIGISGGNDGSLSYWNILAYDGFGYHYITRRGASNAQVLHDFVVTGGVTSSNNTGDVLYILYEEASATDNRDMAKVEQVTINPLTSTTKTYEPSGILTTPFHDGGMSDVDSVVIGVGVTGENLDTVANANELIKVSIDQDYSGSFGNELTWGSDSNIFQSYASGAGLSSKTWAFKYTLSRDGGTPTNTPTLRYGVGYYEKVFPALSAFEFEIDVPATIALNRNSIPDVDALLGLLRTAKTSVTLIAFQYPALSTASYVRIKTDPMVHIGSGNPTSPEQGITDGNIFIRVEEKV